MNGGRLNIAACSIGGAQFCLDTAQEYVQNRVQFQQPVASFQNTAFKLADMATAVQASRLMVRCCPQLSSNLMSVQWFKPNMQQCQACCCFTGCKAARFSCHDLWLCLCLFVFHHNVTSCCYVLPESGTSTLVFAVCLLACEFGQRQCPVCGARAISSRSSSISIQHVRQSSLSSEGCKPGGTVQTQVLNLTQCLCAGMLPSVWTTTLLLLQLMLQWPRGLPQMHATRLQMMLCNCMEGE